MKLCSKNGNPTKRVMTQFSRIIITQAMTVPGRAGVPAGGGGCRGQVRGRGGGVARHDADIPQHNTHWGADAGIHQRVRSVLQTHALLVS